jgi:hypothetical protein
MQLIGIDIVLSVSNVLSGKNALTLSAFATEKPQQKLHAHEQFCPGKRTSSLKWL